MSAPTRVSSSFTRLVYPFVVVPEGGKGWEAPPNGWLQQAGLAAAEVTIPLSKGPVTESLWEPLEDKELAKSGERLIPTVAQYLGGGARGLAGAGDGSAPFVRMRAFASERTSKDLCGGLLAVGFKENDGRVAYTFAMTRLELYLFDTAVGFLVLEVTPRQVVPVSAAGVPGAGRSFELADVAELNCELRQIRPGAPRLARWLGSAEGAAALFAKASGAAEAPAGPLLERVRAGQAFVLQELVDWCLEPLARDHLSCVAMATPYLLGLSFNLVEPPPAGAAESPAEALFDPYAADFFRLRRMYGSRYVPPPEQRRFEDNSEVVRTFERVCFGVCAEGMAVLVLDDGKTQFFHGLGDRVRRGYFSLLLLALHQRSVLELLALRASRLHDLSEMGRELPRDFLDRVHDLRLEAFDITLHHSFPSTSLTTMYQEVYECLLAAMRVEPLHQALRDALEEMDDLLQRLRDARREKGGRRLERFVAALGALGVYFALWGVNWREVARDGALSFASRGPLVSGAVGLLAVLVALNWDRLRKLV